MNRFVPPKSLLNPMGFKIKPEYNSMAGYKRVLNTRNPFSRLLAAYTDKFYKSANRTAQYGRYWDAARLAEKDEFEIPENYSASFHAFLRNVHSRLYFSLNCVITVCTLLRYVAQQDGENHLQFHWRSISYRCQPCRIGYQYILDLETGMVLKFVFWSANAFRVLIG